MECDGRRLDGDAARSFCGKKVGHCGALINV